MALPLSILALALVFGIPAMFAADATTQSGPPPLVLVHDGNGWTLNGRRVADAELSDVVRGAVETRRHKQLFVQVPATFTYPRLIEALAARVEDGVEQLSLVPPSGDRREAVAVRLEVVPGLEDDVNLAVSPVRVDSAHPPDAIIRLTASGTVDPPAKAALSAGATRGVVRLRIDAARSVADVWPILGAAAAAGATSFLLAIQHPEGPGATARDCRKGLAAACGRLGMAYFSGSDGLSKNHQAALPLLKQGCAGQDGLSCELLGTIYSVNEGVPPNFEESMRYHTESCKLGSDFSCELLRRGGRPIPARKPPLH